MSTDAVVWAKRVHAGSPTRKLVLLVLADYADESWTCFPGQARLAAETELGERTVRRLLAELEAAGLIARQERRREDGYRTSDRIRLCPTSPATSAGENPGTSPANGDNLTGQRRQTSPATVAGQDPSGGSTSRTTRHPPTPRVGPSPRQPELLPDRPAPAAPARRGGHALGSDADLAFGEFWRAYPRKVDKGHARKAWAEVRRRDVDPAVIVAGARAFAADPNLPEPSLIPYPATWLRGERWNDGPLPARRDGPRAQSSSMLAGFAGVAAEARQGAQEGLRALPGGAHRGR